MQLPSKTSIWIRENLTDRANRSIRKAVAAQIEDGEVVLDVGCANGQFLMELSPRIKAGFGVDLDEKWINHARIKSQTLSIQNLQFLHCDAAEIPNDLNPTPTTVTAMLALHEMGTDKAIESLKRLKDISQKLVIADFIEPKSIFNKVFLHFDEMMAGHHHRYLEYRDFGGMEALLQKAEIKVLSFEKIRSEVGLWVCRD